MIYKTVHELNNEERKKVLEVLRYNAKLRNSYELEANNNNTFL